MHKENNKESIAVTYNPKTNEITEGYGTEDLKIPYYTQECRKFFLNHSIIEIDKNKALINHNLTQKIHCQFYPSQEDIKYQQTELIIEMANSTYKITEETSEFYAHNVIINNKIKYTDELLKNDKTLLKIYIKKRVQYYKNKYTAFKNNKYQKSLENFIKNIDLSKEEYPRNVLNKKIKEFLKKSSHIMEANKSNLANNNKNKPLSLTNVSPLNQGGKSQNLQKY